MLSPRAPRWMDQKLDRLSQLFVLADLAEDTLRERLDAIARRIDKLRAEVSEAVLDDFDEKLIVGSTFDGFLQFSPAGLMNTSRELFCGGSELKLVRDRHVAHDTYLFLQGEEIHHDLHQRLRQK